ELPQETVESTAATPEPAAKPPEEPALSQPGPDPTPTALATNATASPSSTSPGIAFEVEPQVVPSTAPSDTPENT
ncbi:MAG: hypothetical protein M1608_17580, partial [Candidatus Omnitrophica bacterium]|nr:hypothetical protein [Candidatus Omnitrophota bacterium]